MPKKFLGISGQDPSDSKSNQLHVDNVCVWRISFDVQLQIQSVTQRFQKWKWMLIDIHISF